MKSYVDIDQAKKLMEILPLDSADYFYMRSIDNFNAIRYTLETYPYNKGAKDHDLPCWSLASLYSILPNNKEKSTDLSRGGWDMDPLEYNDKWWCEYEDESEERVSVTADNPIDACYEMIVKLHKLNLL